MSFQTANGKLFYRIGDVIITVNNQNPAQWYGGTWEIFAPGRTLVCLDSSQPEFNTIKKTGGEKSHTLTIDEMPNHMHVASITSAGEHDHKIGERGGYTRANLDSHAAIGFAYGQQEYDYRTSISGGHSHNVVVNSTGGSKGHNILQPFMVVYMWIRIA